VQHTKTGKKYQNGRKIEKMAIKFTITPKLTQIGIFGSKTNHLATLLTAIVDAGCHFERIYRK
jgi:hypothetical protein